MAGINFFHYSSHAHSAFPAGSAFAAGFMFKELGDTGNHIHNIPVLIQNEDCTGTQSGTGLPHGVKINGGIQQGFRDKTSRGTADLYRFEFFISCYSLTEFKNNIPDSCIRRNFDKGSVFSHT
jgi:hypothetical protein